MQPITIDCLHQHRTRKRSLIPLVRKRKPAGRKKFISEVLTELERRELCKKRLICKAIHGRKPLRSVLDSVVHKSIGRNRPALSQSFALLSPTEEYGTLYDLCITIFVNMDHSEVIGLVTRTMMDSNFQQRTKYAGYRLKESEYQHTSHRCGC
ncbi:hypothetical protein TNCV_4030911 [Trichonephila clavipes]|nr:hypothetical protein TNCV_4030911 [Trichonephila clavipes]